MADGIQYDVSATLKVSGGASFQNDMGRAANSASALQAAFDKVTGGAGRVSSGLMGLGGVAAETVGRVVAVGTAAAAATVAGSAMAVGAVGKNLAMLEGKSIQLSSVIAAATERSFAGVQAETGDLFQKFKMDAVQSAGGMADFVDTASKIAAPILGAGRSMEELRNITKGVIATAPALGVEFKQAGSDVMRMLQGSAGADLPFFQALKSIPSLGIESAEAFNKLAPEKRIDTIKKALTNPAFLAASDAAGESFKGLWATTEDLAMTIGGLAVSPAFGVLKRNLSGITKELIAGLGKDGILRAGLSDLGGVIGYRFGQMSTILGGLFPNLNGSLAATVGWMTRLADDGLGRVVSGVSWVADHWVQINDGARRFAGWVSEAADKAVDLVRTLGGGDLGKGLERAALLYGGSKVAAPAAQVALGGAQMAQGAFSAGKWAMGLFGAGTAGTAATAATTATAATGAAGAAAGGAGTAAAGGAAAAAGGAGVLATGGLLAGAAGFLALTYEAIEADTFGFVQVIQQSWAELTVSASGLHQSGVALWTSLGGLWDAVVKLYEASRPLIGVFASIHTIPLAAFFEGVLTAATAAAGALSTVATYLQMMATHATEGADKLALMVDKVASILGLSKYESPREDRGRFAVDTSTLPGLAFSTASSASLSAGTSTPRKPPSGGKQSVEVTIKWDLGEGNEDAIYVRSRRDITEMIKNAQGFARGAPLPGRF